MKNITTKTIVRALGVLALGVVIGWLLFGDSNTSSETHQHEATETIWTCSMHPQIQQNEPGKCPLCGMDLIPLTNSDAAIDPLAVKMSETAMQLAAIQTMRVGEAGQTKALRLNGKVQADERLIFTQTTHIPGRIEELAVNFKGDFVNKGQVIAYVYSPDLVTAQEELFEALKIKEKQPALYKAAIEKLKNWKLSQEQIESIIAEQKTAEVFPIISDFTGFVTLKKVNNGDHLMQGEVLYEIADLSKVWVLFDVYESDMTWIKKGQEIEYDIASVPGKTFKGRVQYIDPIIDSKTRVSKARVEVQNTNFTLKPEMFASGTLKGNISNKNKISVPKTAVMWTGKRSVVYVQNKNAEGVTFKLREIVLGADLGDSFVVESGLNQGEIIAINGTFSIDAAAQLAGKPSMMNHESSSSEASNKEVPQEATNDVQALLESYFSLKTALSQDNYKQATKAGIKMKNKLSSIEMAHFSGDYHMVWMEQSSLLEKKLSQLETSKGIDAIRSLFIGISESMVVLAEQFAQPSTPIYIQHCPMANSNKGAHWLSVDLEILNPYFGSQMLSCGSTVKTIN